MGDKPCTCSAVSNSLHDHNTIIDRGRQDILASAPRAPDEMVANVSGGDVRPEIELAAAAPPLAGVFRASTIRTILGALAPTGVIPLAQTGIRFLEESLATGTPGANATLITILSLADVLAAQTAVMSENGAAGAGAGAGEARELRLRAAAMRTCRRAITEFRASAFRASVPEKTK